GLAICPGTSVHGATAFFVDGRGLTIEDAWTEGDVIYLRLPGGGIIGTERARVQRVVFHRRPTPLATPQEKASPAGGGAPRSALAELVGRVASRYSVDPAIILAMVETESHFDPGAVSRVGAVGLMQLMPSTAAELKVEDPFDPEQNIEGGIRYLKGMLDRFGGRLDLALAAYNAGPAAVQWYGGIPPFLETREYVERVLARSNR
ncbi:MAG: lytic transglycosylase domain-containing protein, partial [Acidobacteriota bacterium]